MYLSPTLYRRLRPHSPYRCMSLHTRILLSFLYPCLTTRGSLKSRRRPKAPSRSTVRWQTNLGDAVFVSARVILS